MVTRRSWFAAILGLPAILRARISPPRDRVLEFLARQPERTPEQYLHGLKFFSGHSQWDPSIVAQREKSGRLSLTINRLPGIASHWNVRRPKNIPHLTPQQLSDFKVAIAYLHMGTQRMFNHTYSSYVECVIAKAPQSVMTEQVKQLAMLNEEFTKEI